MTNRAPQHLRLVSTTENHHDNFKQCCYKFSTHTGLLETALHISNQPTPYHLSHLHPGKELIN